MRDFKNKVAVVTGAASGIGRAMAQRYAAEGMHLVLADIEAEPAGVQAIARKVDVAKPDDLEMLAGAAYDEFGAVHLLCNNAGVFPPGAPAWSEPLGNWHWTLNVNFFGVLHGVLAFVPRMLKSGEEGHIVNTASLAGLTARPLMSAYNVSKHAVVALSECLYAELQLTTNQLHISVLCPAFAKTRLAESTRNKPTDAPADPDASFGFFDTLKNVVEEGTPPEVIANAVVEAVQEQRFWILTHPEYDSSIRDRFESILSRTNPQVRDLRREKTPLT